MGDPEPTDEELVNNPELALRGMSEDDFAKIGSLTFFLLDVIAAAKERLKARCRERQGTKERT